MSDRRAAPQRQAFTSWRVAIDKALIYGWQMGRKYRVTGVPGRPGCWRIFRTTELFKHAPCQHGRREVRAS